jgi:RNA polymerase sigma-70 factor (ECF subfamily)
MDDVPGALDEAAFERLAGVSRRELQLHCYRMLGSIQDAEDAVQEAYLRAWRGRETFTGRGSLRGWLHRIATNVCLRTLERRAVARRMLPEALGGSVAFETLGPPATDISWLEPYPVSPLEQATDPAPGPDARYETREAISLAFLATLQALPPRQRAALLLRDVVGLSASETAAILNVSAAATNSALQRARATIEARYRGARPAAPLVGDPAHQRLLDRYVQAWEAADLDGLVRLPTSAPSSAGHGATVPATGG